MRHHIVTGLSLAQVRAQRPDLRAHEVLVYGKLPDTNGAAVDPLDRIDIVKPVDAGFTAVRDELVRRRNVTRPAAGPVMAAVLSGVRRAGFRDAVTTVTELDAMPDNTIIRGVRSGVTFEARTHGTGRVWFATGCEVEDTSEYIVDNEAGAFAVLYRPDTARVAA